MSKKQFEHIENKFREAAENFQPSVNEVAWNKMELLLNQEDEKRKRPAGIWFYGMILLLLTGGLGTYFLISSVDPAQPGKSERMRSTPAVTEKKITGSTPEMKISPPSAEAEKKPPRLTGNPTPVSEQSIEEKRVEVKAPETREVKVPGLNKAERGNGQLIKKPSTDKNAKPYQFKDSDLLTTADLSTVDEQKRKAARYSGNPPESRLTEEQAVATAPKDNTPASTQVAPGLSSDQAEKNKPKANVTLRKIDQLKADNKIPLQAKQQPAKHLQQQAVNSIASKFYFTASIASDVNTIPGTAIKKVSPMYGIGIGYQLNDKFSIQTGLYAGSKKYAADSNSYYAKSPYWRMVKIRSIEADCYVFSLPLSVRYNISSGRKGNFYGTAGLSSYFMQKESYDYYYTYRYNDTVRFRKEVYGGNNHLFSVLDLSIGYEHRLSSHLSIQGEPYFKLPMKGVGEGQVHLYSAGFMLGLKFRP